MIMLLASLVCLAIHFTFLYFLQIPVLPLTRLVDPFLSRFVSDTLHVNRAVIAGMRRKETIIAVWRINWGFLLSGERLRKAAELLADGVPLLRSLSNVVSRKSGTGADRQWTTTIHVRDTKSLLLQC